MGPGKPGPGPGGPRQKSHWASLLFLTPSNQFVVGNQSKSEIKWALLLTVPILFLALQTVALSIIRVQPRDLYWKVADIIKKKTWRAHDA